MKNLLLCLGFLTLLLSCSQHSTNPEIDKFHVNKLVEWNRHLTNAIITDYFTPPQCARIYAYANLAAYESMTYSDSSFTSLATKANGFGTPIKPSGKEVSYPVAAIIAFSKVSQKMVYSNHLIIDLENKYLNDLDSIGIDPRIKKNSIEFGKEISKYILYRSGNDGYLQRSAKIDYVVSGDPGKWIPTPPDYADAIEPNWNTILPMFLDSADQFEPGSPIPFDSVPGSDFYNSSIQVYESVNNLDSSSLEIARFWDCNPNVSFTQGHVMFFKQQISPGGHWVHIACQVAEAKKLDELNASALLAKVSMTINDAFISCWDEKFRSNLIRPVTYINRYIDPDWRPVLQTPPFPEHTSGHSVASSSAATMLTHLIGESFQFTDSTEVPFGLPARKFNSFFEAANEAAISRLYGGIHYMPAIELGINQGKKVGHFVINKIESQ